MGKPGRHRAKLDELLTFLCVTLHAPQPRRELPHNFPRHRRRGAQQVPESGARQTKKPTVSDRPIEHKIRDVQQNWNLAEEVFRKPRREKNFLFAIEFCRTQLAFQHHIEEIRRIALAKDYLPSREANLSSHRKTLALRLVELSEKRDVENCRKPSFRNGGRLRRGTRFHFLKLLRQLSHIRASRDDCLGAFISFNLPHRQSHDESRFTRFRFNFDLTAMPVSHNSLAYRKAETFSRADALGGEKRLKYFRKILR